MKLGETKKKKLLFWANAPEKDEEGEVYVDLPDEVSERAINSLVKEILRDPTINIPLIPDRLEGKLYRSTIKLTLSAIYKVIKEGLDESVFIKDHEFRLKHYLAPEHRKKSGFNPEAYCQRHQVNYIDDKLLTQMANRLLENKDINQPLIPDVLERLIYSNCLKVVFRVLDIVASSLRLTICGHSIGIYLNGTAQQSTNQSLRRSTTNIVSSLSNATQLHALAEDAGIIDEPPRKRKSFMSQMHATLYGLALGIVHDMVEQTELEFVGLGKIIIDLVPTSSAKNKDDADVVVAKKALIQKSSNTSVIFISILLGMGLSKLLERWSIHPERLLGNVVSKIRSGVVWSKLQPARLWPNKKKRATSKSKGETYDDDEDQ